MLLTLPQTLELSELRQIVYSQFKMNDDQMILFYKGRLLTNEGIVTLANRSIVHILNYDKINKE